MMSTLVSCYVVLANAPLIEAFVSKSVNMRLKNWSIHYHRGGLLRFYSKNNFDVSNKNISTITEGM